MTKYNSVGQTFAQISVRAYRLEVLFAFAQSGIAVNKLMSPTLKRLLERDRSSLIDMMDFAPMLGRNIQIC